ncbi:MAG: hypothetical protein WC775_05650 [Patescibacteria group bacterium]
MERYNPKIATLSVAIFLRRKIMLRGKSLLLTMLLSVLLSACGGAAGPVARFDITYACQPKGQQNVPNVTCHMVVDVFRDEMNTEGRAFGISTKLAADSQLQDEWAAPKYSRPGGSDELANWAFANGIVVKVTGTTSAPEITATSPFYKDAENKDTTTPIYRISKQQ